jgi:ferritin
MKKPLKLNKEIVNLIMPRHSDEMTAFMFYRNAANWCQNEGFFLAAKFFNEESADELKHAKIWEDYLTSWNVMPQIGDVEEQDVSYKSLSGLIESAYDIEKTLYDSYEQTTSDVLATGDMCTFFFLAQFNEIQRTSMSLYSDMINILTGTEEDSKFELLMLEEKLFGE